MKDILKNYIEQDMLSNRGGSELAHDDNLLTTGLVDSVGMMSLVVFIEDTFDLSVPPQDVTIENFLSINTIDAYLKTRGAGV
mgnify:CR=1 FL=1